MFLIAELVVLLTTNLILTQALGTSTLFIAAGSKKNLLWTAIGGGILYKQASSIVYGRFPTAVLCACNRNIICFASRCHLFCGQKEF